MKHIVAAVLLSLALPCSVFGAKPVDWSEELVPAQEALAHSDFEAAYAQYLQAAERNPLAQFTLGQFHQNGWGRAKDPVAACAWFEKAAQHHVPAAEYYLGDCLAHGIGRAVDVPAAIGWYEKAGAQGFLISWCSAADFYIRGEGVAKDATKGLELCTQAARAGSPQAMMKLARYHQEGHGIPQDLATARRWYEEAAQIHVNEAQYRLGVMLANGEGGAADASAALFWLETAASDGYAPAYLPTAVLYAYAAPQKDTGALSPEHLAKIYLWTEAAKARGDGAEQAEAQKLETQVLAVMPATWRPDLDKKVAEHLSKFSR